MATGYGAVLFDVVTDDGSFPRVVVDDARLGTYSATVILADADALDALALLRSFVTTKTAYGKIGGKVIVDVGPGTADLVIPVDNGAEETWDAILIALAPTAWGLSDGYLHAEATWLCLSRTA